jgi:hypothetical protein
MMDCKPKQIGICNLFVTRQIGFQIGCCLSKAEIIRPELVRGMTQVLFQQSNRLRRSNSFRRKSRIRNDPDKCRLSKRTGCPFFLFVFPEPLLGRIVVAVICPKQGYQCIHIQENCGHYRTVSISCSLSSLRTRSMLTLEVPPPEKTRSPFTIWVGAGRENPRRISSEAARPRLIGCPLAN